MKLATRALAVLLTISALATTPAIAGLSWYPDDGCAPGVTADGYFWAAGPAAYWTVASGGWNNCHLETSTTTGAVTNWAEWYLPTNSSYTGRYALDAYISGAGPQPYTTEATYLAWGNGHSGGVTQAQILNQSANQGGFCYIFGPTTNMNGPLGGLMEIVDQNTKADGYIYVDVFCFVAQ